MDKKDKKFVLASSDRIDGLPGFMEWVEETFETEVIFVSDESAVCDFLSNLEIEKDPGRWVALQKRFADQGIAISRDDLLVDVYEQVLRARNPQ